MLPLIGGTALVAATATLLAAQLSDRDLAQLLLGIYVVGFAEVVLVSLALSAGSELTRTSVLASILGLFVLSLAVTLRARPRWPELAGRELLLALRNPAVAVVALAAFGVVAYSIALALFRPPTDQDALEYHLARAAFWRQQESIGYVHGAAYEPINGYPPNAEIAMAFTMILSGSGRFAPLVQLLAALATGVAVYGIARRIGLGREPALFSGLLLLTLPAVALQASTGLNDIVVASFVACAAFLLLGATWSSLLLAVAATALLVGSKLIGLLALPGLALVAIVAQRHRPWRALSAVALGALIGSYWYVINLEKTGDPFGGISDERVGPDPVAALARVVRLSINVLELPGAVRLDRLLFVAAALVLATTALMGPASRSRRLTYAAIAAGLTVSALAITPVAELLARASRKAFYEFGRGDVGYLDSERSTTKASAIFSWYGPVGVLLTFLGFAVVLRAVRRRELPPVALALAAAPAIWVVLIGVTTPYYEWNGGRFAMGSFALAAATWGVVFRMPPVVWATAALTVVTATLAFLHLHEKPAGLRLIEPIAEPSVWSQSDWALQGTDHPELKAVLRFVDRRIPDDARLAIEPMGTKDRTAPWGLPPFPFFGESLSRTVLLERSADGARRDGADWAILSQGRVGACEAGWRVAFRHRPWVILRRVNGASCA